jgi:pilus assembly protein Flp/PilA
MKNLMNSMKSFWQDEEGVTAIEYGLIAALIAVMIIAGAQLVGINLNALFNQIGQCLANPAGC